MFALESTRQFRTLRNAGVALACAMLLGNAAAQQPTGAAPALAPAAHDAPLGPSAAAPSRGVAGAAAGVPLPGSPMSAATAAEIQKINEQMTLLQAQLNQLELKAKIASKQKEISGATGETPVQSSFASRNGNPSVVSVSGLKGKLDAVLVFPGGVTQRVRAGDVIDDRRVAKVALTEVVLTDLKGKSIQRLAFGASPVTRENTPLPGNGVLPSPVMPLPAGMPAMPPR
jgi:type IV pilus biogenesis protein PilP